MTICEKSGTSVDRRYVNFEEVKSAGLPVERFPETLQEAQVAEDLKRITSESKPLRAYRVEAIG